MNPNIIDQIKLKLTKQKEVDLPYLQTELQIYQSLGQDEIAYGITMLIWDYLSEEEKQKYDQEAHKTLSVREQHYQSALKYYNLQNFDEAKKILLRLIYPYQYIIPLNKNHYFDFDQQIEYILYCENVQKAKDLNIKRCPEPIVYLYYLLVQIANSNNNYQEAIDYAQQALRYNPCSIYILQELAVCYYNGNSLDNMLIVLKRILKYAYEKKQFAFAYYWIGRIYEDKNQYNIAIASFFLSDNYSGSPKCQSDIERLIQKNGKIMFQSANDILDIFKREDLQYGPSQLLISVVEQFYPYLLSIKDYQGALDIITIVNKLTNGYLYDEEIKDISKKINVYK